MDLSSDVLLALVGFLLLTSGAFVFWWMDRRAESSAPQEVFADPANALSETVLALRSVRADNGAITELRCSFLNPAGERLLGVRAVDLVGQSLRKKLPGLVGTGHFAAYTAFIDHDIVPTTLVRMDQAGRERWLERSVGRYGDGLVVLLRDVTDALREERLSRMRERLAAMTDAARTAAHDLRDPLTNLALVEDQLRMDLQDRPDVVPYLDMLRRNTDRLREMIDSMVSVNHQPDLALRSVDVGEMVRELLEALTGRARAAQVELRRDGDPPTAIIQADAHVLRPALAQVFASVIDVLGSGDLLHVRLEQRTHMMVLERSATTAKGSLEGATRVMRQAYRPIPDGTVPPLGHVHGILLAHGAHLDMEMPRGGGVVWRIAFPIAAQG